MSDLVRNVSRPVMALALDDPNDNGFEQVLAGLDGRRRGFERLVAWFLLNDPEWSARVRQVWLWDDGPGNFGPDRGIDLVAETHDDLVASVITRRGMSSCVRNARASP
jgi:hypothetical protein